MKIPQSADSLAKFLEPTNTAINKAMYAADHETIISYFSEDAVIKPSNRPALHGIHEIRKSYDEQKKSGVKILSFTPSTEKIWSSGNEIYEYGTFAEAVTYKDAKEPKAYSGSYFLVWEVKSDGTVKIKYMMNNLDFLPGQ